MRFGSFIDAASATVSIDGAAVERLSTSMREALESLARGDSGINVAPIDGLFDAAPARRAGLLSKLFSK